MAPAIDIVYAGDAYQIVFQLFRNDTKLPWDVSTMTVAGTWHIENEDGTCTPATAIAVTMTNAVLGQGNIIWGSGLTTAGLLAVQLTVTDVSGNPVHTSIYRRPIGNILS